MRLIYHSIANREKFTAKLKHSREVAVIDVFSFGKAFLLPLRYTPIERSNSVYTKAKRQTQFMKGTAKWREGGGKEEEEEEEEERERYRGIPRGGKRVQWIRATMKMKKSTVRETYVTRQGLYENLITSRGSKKIKHVGPFAKLELSLMKLFLICEYVLCA
jgi:hypothetical protein